jgi:hypothetical protein
MLPRTFDILSETENDERCSTPFRLLFDTIASVSRTDMTVLDFSATPTPYARET